MSVQPTASAGLLTLYREASRVSRTLRVYCEKARPRLTSMDEDDLSACVAYYTDILQLLERLNDRISEIENDSASPAGEQTECEALRRSIRADLKEAAALEDTCRAALERKREETRLLLLQIQKRRRLSAYLQSPLIGQDRVLYDRKD